MADTTDVKLTATIEFKVPIPEGAQVFGSGYTGRMTLGVKVVGDERAQLDEMADTVIASLIAGLTEIAEGRAKRDRTDPRIQAGEGDERIRTAVPALGADSAYEHRSGA